MNYQLRLSSIVFISFLHLVWGYRNDPTAANPPNPQTRAITLPYERARSIRGCSECSNSRGKSGEQACVPSACEAPGTRCSAISDFGEKFVTATSHFCKRRNGGPGTRLFCCEKGSREALNILTLRARPNQYPHHAYLAIKSMDEDTQKLHYLNCGGTILNEWWILTAAHCIKGPPAYSGGKPLQALQMIAIVGQNHIRMAEKGNRYEIDLEQSVYHPNFSYRPFINDIALVKLKKPLELNGYVKPIRIANSSFVEEGTVEIIGFGKTDMSRSLNALLTDTATIMDNQKCERITGIPKPKILMCVGGENEAIPNQGDSGGPAICRDKNNEPVVCGITSNISQTVICESGRRKRLNIRVGEALPRGCGYPPAVYTRVSQFYDWVMDTMNKSNDTAKLSDSHSSYYY